MTAAAELEKSGIRTSASLVFSVPQALAAAQAECLYITPYLNDLAVLFQPATWVAYNDPARENPMALTIRGIAETYATIQPAPDIMVRSIVTAAEALAVSTLGVKHISLPGKVAEELAAGMNEATFRPEVLEENEAIVKPVTIAEEPVDAQVTGKGKCETRYMSGPDTVGYLADRLAISEPVDWLADEGRALDENIRRDVAVSQRLEFAIK